MDILVTAFTPFGGRQTNNSAEALSFLGAEKGISTLLLPTSYERSIAELKKYLSENSVRALVLLGEADRDRLTVERVAINVADCSLPDNDGVVMEDAPLEYNAPAAYFSTLPLKKMLAAADCRISNSAGTYVCNSLMYRALRLVEKENIPCGFIHVPINADAALCAAELIKMLSVL